MRRLILLWVFFPFILQAQKQKPRPFTEVNHAISVNLFALAQLDYTALFGYEKKLRPQLFLSAEAGYIFSSGYLSDTDDPSQNGCGFLLRPSVKWFIDKNQKFYLQPQAFYKQVTHRRHDWVGKNAVNGIPAYEELQDFKYRRRIIGFNAVAGFALALDQHKNAYVDFYFGLGIRRKKSFVLDEPNSVYRESSQDFIFPDGFDNGIFPSLPLGIRFIYAIN